MGRHRTYLPYAGGIRCSGGFALVIDFVVGSGRAKVQIAFALHVWRGKFCFLS